MRTVLVTGATGTVGSALVEELRSRDDVRVRAASRRGRPVNGAAGVRLDFADPSSWQGALDGADTLFLVRPPSMSRVAPLDAFVRHARSTGVRRITFLSLLGAERSPVTPHRRVEAVLESLDVEWTFLRAGFFMQNLLGPHRPDIVEHDEIIVPAGRGTTSFVDTRDLARAAARVLSEDGHGRRAYDLTGPEALDYHDVAAILSDVLGRTIAYREPSLLRFARAMRHRGHPWLYIAVMGAIYSTARLGLAGRVAPDLTALLGHRPTSMRTFAEDHAAAFRPG